MKKITVIPVSIFLALFLVLVLFLSVSAETQLVVNSHAMGVNGDICPTTHNVNQPAGEGWQYNGYITLSKCGRKNSDEGAMFKNGPIGTNGAGLPGIPAKMWQDYDMAGFSGDLSIDFSIEVVSVGGTEFHAYLYSSDDGVNFVNPIDLVSWPDGGCGLGSKYPTYCSTNVVPYANYMRLEIVSVWQQQLGQKWANISLVVNGSGEALPDPNPDPTPTPSGCFYNHCKWLPSVNN